MAHHLALHHRIPGAAFDSAGTHAGERAEPIDPRAAAALQRRGVTPRPKARSRRILEADFERFDLLLAMDHDNRVNLLDLCPDAHRFKVRLFMDLVEPGADREVPDPYYGGPEGFDRVLDLCEAGVRAIEDRIRRGVGFD